MRLKAPLAFVAPVFALMSCAQEELSNDILNPNLEAVSSNQIKVCLDKTVVYDNDDARSGKALDKYKLWENGSTLKVKFLDGGNFVQRKVMEYAKIWEQYANIKFEEVTSGDADIKISFEQEGSWSYIGTDAKYYNIDGATMNFGWFDTGTSEEEFSRTTLHEFGHALGAIHEHQSPANGIQWNRPVVYEYYESTFGWDRARVDSNIFTQYDESSSTYSEYDPDSIMHYFLDQSFTLDDHSVGSNFELSSTDKFFIGETYPFDSVGASSKNLALGKETSQISTHIDLPGESSRAVDGDTSGKWSLNSITRTATEDLPWWQVRLGNDYAIGEIKIWNRTDRCCAMKLVNFDVFVYNDAGDLTFKTTIEDVPSPSVTINARGAIGSRIRVKLKDTNQLSLAEVEVFEY